MCIQDSVSSDDLSRNLIISQGGREEKNPHNYHREDSVFKMICFLINGLMFQSNTLYSFNCKEKSQSLRSDCRLRGKKLKISFWLPESWIKYIFTILKENGSFTPVMSVMTFLIGSFDGKGQESFGGFLRIYRVKLKHGYYLFSCLFSTEISVFF